MTLYSGPFLRIFQWKGQLRKGTNYEKGLQGENVYLYF